LRCWLLLVPKQSRFSQMSDAIVSRIDEMGDRIDGLEKSIADLMNQAGADADEDNALADSREANETAASAQDEEVSADAS